MRDILAGIVGGFFGLVVFVLIYAFTFTILCLSIGLVYFLICIGFGLTFSWWVVLGITGVILLGKIAYKFICGKTN